MSDRLAQKWLGPAILACASLAAAIVMWGFTVDDALISIRYARHLAAGAGWRFNVGGAATDGVTPLPWPLVVALFAHAPPLVVLLRLKVIGIVLHAIAAGTIAASVRGAPLRGVITTAIAIAACLPMAAWGASGMETPLATVLCAMCVFYMKDVRAAVPHAGSFAPHTPGGGSRTAPLRSAVLAGLAASVRPELLPWAAAIACGFALARRAGARAVIASVLVAAAPFATCAIVRGSVFGHFAPLAVLAKPSDLSHGLVYAAAAVLATGAPILLASRARSPIVTTITVAFAVHVLAIALAGGDSMPYARLLVPVLPSVFVAHLHLASNSHGPVFWLRSAIAIGLAGWTFVTAGPRGRDVMRDRADLVSRATPVFADAQRIAAVDIGWVSAAYEGPIVDLAGLTDPDIAALRGGHTSKHVDASMLLDRGVDTVVLYTEHDLYAHAVAVRLASDPLFSSRYVERASLPLGDRGSGYVVFKRRARTSPDGEGAQPAP